MNPVIAPAATPSSLPVANAQTKGSGDPAGQLAAAASPTSGGQPNFSAIVKMLFAGTAPSETGAGAVAGQAGVVPLPKAQAAPRSAAKTKTADGSINPAAAIAANLLPTATPPITKDTQPLPGEVSAKAPVEGALPNLPTVVAAPSAPHGDSAAASAIEGTLPNLAAPVAGSDGAAFASALAAANAKPGTSAPEQASQQIPTAVPAIASPREPSATKDAVALSGASVNAVVAPRADPIAPAPPPPIAPLAHQVHDLIVGHLDQLQQQGRLELQLNLHPPELGRVQLHLTLEDGHLNVRMVVQDDNAKRLIDQQLGPLRVRFAEMGVSVGQFDVRRDGGSPHPEQQPAAEPSAQTLQADSSAASRLQKTYGRVGNANALVDVIA